MQPNTLFKSWFQLFIFVLHPNASETSASNVLFIVVDNLRPALGVYDVPQAVTPHIDALAASATVFTRAFCQEAWCSPSRNSFLTGRRPLETKAWNFLDDFRRNSDGSPGPGASWVTLPQYFKQQGFYTTSSGKVFHPSLPADFDYPRSWSDVPVLQSKSECKTPDQVWPATMFCELNATDDDADAATATVIIDRLTAWSVNSTIQQGMPFFAAAGFQGPRLPWSYPKSILSRLPAVRDVMIAKHRGSPANSGPPSRHDHGMDWFRPTEIAWYGDVVADGGITHSRPLSPSFQKKARLAYSASITHIDNQVGRLLSLLKNLQVDEKTVVCFTADHAQNLGEGNMWSMMSLREQALRVPLIIRPSNAAAYIHKTRTDTRHKRMYNHPVELIDLYPTLVSLAGLPLPSSKFNLPGSDLSLGMTTGSVVKPVNAAFSEITRCRNCTEAYLNDSLTYQLGCAKDIVDASTYLVPCALTPRRKFDFMGMSVRQKDWRYSLFCPWDQLKLKSHFQNCTGYELYSHANDTALYNVDDNGEQHNLAGRPEYSKVQADLHALIVHIYG